MALAMAIAMVIAMTHDNARHAFDLLILFEHSKRRCGAWPDLGADGSSGSCGDALGGGCWLLSCRVLSPGRREIRPLQIQRPVLHGVTVVVEYGQVRMRPVTVWY
jgi:hypothetical protein